MIDQNHVIDVGFTVGQLAHLMATVAARTIGLSGDDVSEFAVAHLNDYLPAATVFAEDPSAILQSMDGERENVECKGK